MKKFEKIVNELYGHPSRYSPEEEEPEIGPSDQILVPNLKEPIKTNVQRNAATMYVLIKRFLKTPRNRTQDITIEMIDVIDKIEGGYKY